MSCFECIRLNVTGGVAAPTSQLPGIVSQVGEDSGQKVPRPYSAVRNVRGSHCHGCASHGRVRPWHLLSTQWKLINATLRQCQLPLLMLSFLFSGPILAPLLPI